MSRFGKQGSAVSPLLWAMALAAVLLSVSFSATRAHAQVQQELPPGDRIIFEECTLVSVTVQESDAAFTNVFWRFDPTGNLGINSKQVGETVVIGEVPAGVELILGIVVNETGKTYKTGPGERNPDGLVHAVVDGTYVGFEDKALGEVWADFDYNDAILRLTLAPCRPPQPQQATLTVQVDPASTGTGGVGGGGIYDFGTVANAAASAAAGSTFGGWSGDCSGANTSFAVVMNGNKLCVALFLAAPVEPTPSPTPAPTVEVLPSTVGIDNTLASPNPARVGETVSFRVDVALDVPAANTADVEYTFDDSELKYLGASWNGISLSQCSLTGAGVIDCAFGTVSIDFSFDLTFEALKTADASTTAASLSSDPDGAGAETAIAAGPALADVDIIAIAGGMPDTGDGSVTSGSTVSIQLLVLLGATVLVTVAGAARLRTGARS